MQIFSKKGNFTFGSRVISIWQIELQKISIQNSHLSLLMHRNEQNGDKICEKFKLYKGIIEYWLWQERNFVIFLYSKGFWLCITWFEYFKLEIEIRESKWKMCRAYFVLSLKYCMQAGRSRFKEKSRDFVKVTWFD